MEIGTRGKKINKRRSVLDDIKNNRLGGSRLDSHELVEEEDVYDLVDESEYVQLVEKRRQGNEFVVDDNGLGYRDDGEEVLGVKEDEFEKKKRILAGDIDEPDYDEDISKKKAQRLNKAAAQGIGMANTMFSYVKTGQTTTKMASSAITAQQDLDIDKLLDDVSAKPQSSRRPVARSFNRAPQSYRSELPTNLAPSRATDYYTQDVHTYSEEVVENNNYDDHDDDHYDAGPSSPLPLEKNYSNVPAAKLENNASSVSSGLGKEEPSKQMEMETAIEEKEKEKEVKMEEESSEKISFSKGVRKIKSSIQPSNQSSFEGNALLGMDTGEISDIAGTNTDSSIDKAAQIDPSLWLKKTTFPGEEQASEYLQMFWIDATESNGIIYLFGKVEIANPNDPKKGSKFVSCSVAINGNERNLFVLAKPAGSFNADGTPVRADMNQVYQELNKMLVPAIIPKTQGQSFRCKTVKRKYAFEYDEIPREETEYLKVVYSAKHGVPTPQQCSNGTNSIQRIFGASSSVLELFLLKRKLTGPCWINVRNPRPINGSFSWCKLEVGIDNPKFICKVNDSIPPPPLISMCISMKTVLNPVTHVHEIVSLSAVFHSKVEADGETVEDQSLMRRFTLVRPLGTTCGPGYPPVFPHDMMVEAKKVASKGFVTLPNERAMLDAFFLRLGAEDPDILASHNLFGFEFDVLISRAATCKVSSWSKIGRLRKSRYPKNVLERDFACGRILCDTYKAAMEFVRETTYSLTHLSLSQLQQIRVEVDPIDVPRYFSNSHDILRISEHTACDAMLIQKLMLKLQVVPLTKQLTNLSGNIWNRTIRGARAERIEYLLLHEFHALKYILPERKIIENTKYKMSSLEEEGDNDEPKAGGTARKRDKAGYAGGLVLEPKKGLYDTFILLLDFNSLYPSIIQEYNLCFTTVNWTKYVEDAINKHLQGKTSAKGQETNNTQANDEEEEDDEDHEDVNHVGKGLPPVPDANIPTGVLPRVIKSLVDRRREVKNLLKKERDVVRQNQLDIRQKALKLTANSMYGCLGFKYSRFFAKPIAALVTSMGREALQRTVDLATNQMKLDVIYGDTDSVMINTNCVDLVEVKKIGNEVKKEVNKLYRALEIDLDGIFKSMLLLKKKKYAALTITEIDGKVVYNKELKGLDLVRRDWCPLSKNTGRFVVDEILSGKAKEEIVLTIHEHLSNLAVDVRAGKVELANFVVTKGLNKNPKDYPDSKSQPHLNVALRMLAENKPVNIGDHIPYVICIQGPEGASVTQRAYHPDEVLKSKGELTLDIEWYLSQQILPPISRLCEPIEGTSIAQLSIQLGLDSSRFVSKSNYDDNEFDFEAGFVPRSLLPDAERFKDCEKLKITCKLCENTCEFPGIYSIQNSSGLTCYSCGAMYYGLSNAQACYGYLSNSSTLLIRRCVKKYYDCVLKCDDFTCGRTTNQQFINGYKCIQNCHGRMVQVYNDSALHTQLKYLESLFDIDRKNKDKNSAGTLPPLPKDHEEIFRLLSKHMGFTIANNGYNWIRPSLWSTLFKKK